MKKNLKLLRAEQRLKIPFVVVPLFFLGNIISLDLLPESIIRFRYNKTIPV